MSYQVLARRLRPRNFDGLVGQDHIVRALRNGLDSGRVHHAYLFTGTRGVGKTTIARVLAKCLNCEAGVTSAPCGTCSTCLEIEENRFIDLIEVDAASRTRVDDTRELLDNAQYLPSRGRYKVYLIDEVHMLSASSFNAFLKTLEEPPEHVKFLLATTDPKKVPVTVLSRCLQFQLKNIGRDEIARYIGDVLSGESIEFDPDALRVIAKSAQGSMRDALSITDQAIAYSGGRLTAGDVAAMVGAAGRDETAAVMEALSSGEPQRILEVSAALAEKSVNFGSVLEELLEALHGMAVNHALGEAPGDGLAPEAVHLYYQIALMGYRDLHVGPDPKSCFEMTLLRMLAFAPDAASAARVPGAVGAQAQLPGAPATASAATPAAGETGPAASATTAAGKTKKAMPPSAGRASTTAVERHPPGDDSGTSLATNTGFTQDAGLTQEWYGIVERLGLQGIDLLLAENSMLVERAAGSCRLILDPQQETLLKAGEAPGLEQALTDLLGQSTRLTVEVGPPPEETIARRNARLQQERYQAAKRSLQQNSTVQSLLDVFNGSLDDVRPLPLNEADGQRAGR